MSSHTRDQYVLEARTRFLQKQEEFLKVYHEYLEAQEEYRQISGEQVQVEKKERKTEKGTAPEPHSYPSYGSTYATRAPNECTRCGSPDDRMCFCC